MSHKLIQQYGAFLLFLTLGMQPISAHTTENHLTDARTHTSVPPVEKLQTLDGISRIDTLPSHHYDHKYVLFIEQPVSHTDPSAGTFSQRLILSHRGYDKPVVFVTEGYGAGYALNPRYQEELAEILDANILTVEYRFFLESAPDSIPWNQLTAVNAVNDLHRINETFKNLYPGKWISTGISKGGQTSIYYRAFFPEDVDVSVPYVGPICYGVEDERLEKFLDNIGSPEQQKQLVDYQRILLSRREALMPEFERYCTQKKYRFTVPLQEIFDYCVLEYRFAFWQWGTDFTEIPTLPASDSLLLQDLLKISEPGYFAINGSATDPFFYQAARELGYYGYDVKPYRDLLCIRSSKDYLRRLFAPHEILPNVRFDKGLGKMVKEYIQKNDPEMILIYGEYDPWTGAAIQEEQVRGKKNMHLRTQPGGSHKARINNMPDEMRTEIIQTLKTLLENPD